MLEDRKVSEEEKQSVEVKAPPSPRGEKREAPPSSKSPQGRRKKRLSIEMIKDDGSSTPPKRFSNIPPPRVSCFLSWRLFHKRLLTSIVN